MSNVLAKQSPSSRRFLRAAVLIIALGLLGLVPSYAQGAPCGPDQWSGDYFTGTDLAGTPVGSRCDAEINFDWSVDGPGIPDISTTNYSVQWTTTVSLAAGGYTFTATADDGVRAYLDGNMIINGWRDQGTTTYTASLSVSAGTHTLVVEYYQNGGGAVMRFGYAPVPPPPPTCASTQWTASYFNNVSLSGMPWVVCEDTISYDWGTTGPGLPGIGGSNFSVRWTKTETFEAGTLAVTATADDGVRVFVDDKAVIDQWKDQGPTTYTATPTVTAASHTVAVEYYQGGGGAVARVSYIPPAAPPPPPPTCPATQWLASYHDNTALSGNPTAQRCEDTISYDWGTTGPGLPGIGG
ncbi:MAG: PA14 domain-containing protein, partial [Actinomycetota bacterium]|nr:PA14 domain-containing protein [Actinomycetota bacterium]